MSKARDPLQEAMRARRQAKPLLTPEQLRRREAERLQAETASEAERLVERQRQTATPVDTGGTLSPNVYRAIFALDPHAYYASRHWARRTKAQRTAAPHCEVERCGDRTELYVRHLGVPSPGEEQAGVDLITLCGPCARRAARLARDRRRPLTRRETVKLDPLRPLYEPAAIAALKARYASPLRRSDLPPTT